MTIKSDLAIDMSWLLRTHFACRKSGRHDFTAEACRGPFRPGVLEKIEELPIMHLAQRFHIEFSRGHEVGHLAAPQFAQDVFDTRGPLEGRYELAAIEF